MARYLTAGGEHVEEIDASKHAGKRRNGKSNAIDAVRAAREPLARPAPAQMRADGDREALRLLMCDRDNAVASAKTARTLLASVIVTAPAAIREPLRHIPRDRRATVCAALTSPLAPAGRPRCSIRPSPGSGSESRPSPAPPRTWRSRSPSWWRT